MAETPEIPVGKNPSRRRMMLIGGGIIILVIVAVVVMFLRKPESPWAPATMEFGDCGDDCVDLGSHHFAHAGDVQFFYDRDVDDSVVQWATCLDSAISCIKAGSKEDPSLITECVAASTCPKSCKADYAGRAKADSDLKAQLGYFQQTFLVEGSLCRPVE